MSQTPDRTGGPQQPAPPAAPVDQDFSFEAVPLTQRRGFWRVGFVMLGFTFFSASMSVGANLGYIGAKTGEGLDLLAQRAFGTRGSYLPSALISFTQMGWFGVGVAMFARPTGELLGVGPWPIVIVAGGLMTASAYYGIQAIEIVSFVSVPLIAILGTYSMVAATRDGGGLEAIFSQSTGMTLTVAIGLVVGSFVSGGTATPNFTRFAKTPLVAVITTVIAFFLGNTLMFSFGAVGGAFSGQDDIFYVMIAQGLMIPALIVLGANIWTTNNNALYTTGLGLANITKIRKRPLVLASGILGTLTALWLYDNFIGWLSFLNVSLPPIGAILVIDYIWRRAAYSRPTDPTRTVVWGSVLGVVVGGLAGALIDWGIASINAMVVAVVFYVIGALIHRARTKTPVKES
jgi:cytosine permease